MSIETEALDQAYKDQIAHLFSVLCEGLSEEPEAGTREERPAITRFRRGFVIAAWARQKVFDIVTHKEE